MSTRTMSLLVLLALTIVGCEKGSGPTTTPDEGAPEAEGDEPEESIPDDEDDEGGDEPY